LIAGILLLAIIAVASASGTLTPGGIDSAHPSAGPALGHLAWNFTTGSWISSSPAVTGGVVYIGSDDGNIYALKAGSGEPVWTYRTGNHVSSSPKISGSNVYVGSGDGTFYALDKDTGAITWSSRTRAGISSSPAFDGGNVYIGSEDGTLYAFDAGSGARLWNYSTGQYIHSSPAVSEGNVYFGSYDHTVYALNATTGIPAWKFATGSNVLSSPAVADGIVYIGSQDSNVYALDAGTGKRVWNYTTGNGILSSPTVSGKTVYIGSGDGNLYALDAHTGAVTWSYKTGGVVDSTSLVDGGIVYTGSGDGNLYALNATDGSPLWYYPTGLPVHSSPAIADHLVYIGSYDHAVYALSNLPPVADFTSNVTSGNTPLAVQFTDTSAGSPTAWSWDFGDGENSTLQDPVHTYQASGAMTVKLTAANGGGSDSRVREGYLSTITILPPAPVADFSADGTAGTAPYTVRFTDTSTGLATSWIWDFGDGNTSTRENPEYTFLTPGNFTVTMTAKNRGGSSTKTLDTPVTVKARVIRPGPDFSVNVSSGAPPLTVQFTDASTGPGITGWAWDFNNDGTIDSTDQNPDCVYRLAGNYTVNLTVTNAFGTRTMTRTNAITVINPIPLISFTANTTTGIPPLAVRFNDTSIARNITAWAWDFNNDGITDSTEQNATCVYNQVGNYTVSLTATNVTGSNTTSRQGAVTVTTGIKPGFITNVTYGTVPLAVRFNDTSTGQNITVWAWDFNNDGTVDSTDRNASCVYNIPGNYTVNLTVSNAFGSEKISRPGFIRPTNGVVPDFVANATSGTIPLAVQFKDTSIGAGITGWAWDFNNDSVIDSTDKNPVCIYNRTGNYTVSLTVTNDKGMNTKTKQDLITIGSLNPVAGFTVNSTLGIPPLAVRFSDASTGPGITGWAWDFNNDGVIDSTDQNPVSVYNLLGNYTVSLTVTNAYGSNTTSLPGSVLVTTGAPTARFAMNRTTGSAPLAVQFKDTSTGSGITGWAWDFNNDGVIDSTDPNPASMYTLPGNYTISYTVTNGYGSNTIVRKNFVQVT
jgi:PKD repeat protein